MMLSVVQPHVSQSPFYRFIFILKHLYDSLSQSEPVSASCITAEDSLLSLLREKEALKSMSISLRKPCTTSINGRSKQEETPAQHDARTGEDIARK